MGLRSSILNPASFTPGPLKQIHLGKMLLLSLFTTAVLAGCSGDSSSGSDPLTSQVPAGALTESSGSGEAVAEDVAADDADAQAAAEDPDADLPVVVDDSQADDESADDIVQNPAVPSGKKPGRYTRPEDYPSQVTLPLQFITTAGGKKLGTLVTLPANERGEPIEGKFPVVLVQSGYNIHMLGMVAGTGMSLLGAPDKMLVRRGYAQVSVDALGTGVSEGGWEMFGEDEQAAYGDAVDWVLEQPWSNGNIGVAGASYMGISALFTAQQRPQAIKAVFAAVPIGDAMRGIVGTGGLVNGLFISTWATATHRLGLANQLAARIYPQYRQQIANSNEEHIGQIDNFFVPLVNAALSGEPWITYDGPFWRARSPLDRVDDIKAPTFITGALHDIFQRDEPLFYERLKKNVDTRLAIYEGDHMSHFFQALPGGDEVQPMLSMYLQWFDKYLKGIDSGVENIPPVIQYVKNYNQIHKSKGLWRGYVASTDWPHPQMGAEHWYLRGDLSLSRTAPDGDETSHTMDFPEATEISWGKTDDGRFLVANLTYNDGSDCSISYRQWTLGAAGIFGNKPCYHDNSFVEEKALNFESAPMEDNYYFNGPVLADIWISSTATDAVLSVRLDEVSPTGMIKQISNGLLLASNRAIDESRSRYVDGQLIQPVHYLTEDRVLPVTPGEIIRLPVEIFPTSAIILKGHKLRISISPSNQAQGILNYPRQEQMEGSVITVHNSAEHPSSIVLPVVPMSALIVD